MRIFALAVVAFVFLAFPAVGADCKCGCVQTGQCECRNCNTHTADPGSPDYVVPKPKAKASRFGPWVTERTDGSISWLCADGYRYSYDAATIAQFGDAAILDVITNGYKSQTMQSSAPAIPTYGGVIGFGAAPPTYQRFRFGAAPSCPNGNCPR